MSGKQKRRRVEKEMEGGLPEGLKQVNLNAAGIDVGARSHWVAVPGERSERSVREFGAFTGDLYALSEWLQECGVETVVMESTGSYWINLYEILEEHGIEVKLVDARRVKFVPGRKTDVRDCQWLQQLHTFGLLSGAFRPTDQVVVLRSYMRQRSMLVKHASVHIQHMQKALTQMNVKLQHVVSDLMGVTGEKIIRAILSGERDPLVLSRLRDRRCQHDEETIAKALEGHYRSEHVFALRQAFELYETYRGKIDECDGEIEEFLKTFEEKGGGGEAPGESSKKARKNELGFDARAHLYRITGVDLTKIDGLSGHTALKLVSETGVDMSSWRNSKAFCSWLALCPGSKVSGGKQHDSRTQSSANRAAAAFRLAAQSLYRSHSASGAFLRRMKGRHGSPKAITATAHRLARIYYHMLRHGDAYVDEGQETYEKRHQERILKSMKRRARHFGYELTPIQDLPCAAP